MHRIINFGYYILRGVIPQRECEHFMSDVRSHIVSEAEHLEMELVAIKEKVAEIEDRLKRVAEY